MRVIDGQQAEGDLELARLEIGRRVEVCRDRQFVEDIGFPDLDVLAVRDVRWVLGNELDIDIAVCLPFSGDSVLQVQFRRIDPEATAAASVGAARARVQRAADQKSPPERNGIGQGDFRGRLVGRRRQGRAARRIGFRRSEVQRRGFGLGCRPRRLAQGSQRRLEQDDAGE